MSYLSNLRKLELALSETEDPLGAALDSLQAAEVAADEAGETELGDRLCRIWQLLQQAEEAIMSEQVEVDRLIEESESER